MQQSVQQPFRQWQQPYARAIRLQVVATPDLYDLSVKWASEYNSLFPGANIKVINVSDQQKAGDLIKEGSIGFVSNEFYSGIKQ